MLLKCLIFKREFSQQKVYYTLYLYTSLIFHMRYRNVILDYRMSDQLSKEYRTSVMIVKVATNSWPVSNIRCLL